MKYVGASTVNPLDVITRRDLSLFDSQIDSRNGGLVTNGTGALVDNTGFSQMVFDPSVVPDGMVGSFRADGLYAVFGDQALPVDPALVYRVRCLVKGDAAAVAAGKRFYFGLSPFDALGRNVGAPMTMRLGKKVALTRPWTPNVDTSIFVDADPLWLLSTTLTYQQGVLIYGYVDANGTPHEDYSWNRIEKLWATGAAPTISDIGGGEWEIAGVNPATVTDYSAPHANYTKSSTVPAGVDIAQMTSGGSYMFSGAIYKLLTEEWAECVGYITGVDATGLNRAYNFWPGTTSVKLLFLMNYPPPTAGYTTWVAGLDFRPVSGFTRNELTQPQTGGTYFEQPTDRLDNIDDALAFR